jgi:hypothetical protein
MVGDRYWGSPAAGYGGRFQLVAPAGRTGGSSGKPKPARLESSRQAGGVDDRESAEQYAEKNRLCSPHEKLVCMV